MHIVLLPVLVLYSMLQITLQASNQAIDNIQTCVISKQSQERILENELYLPQLRRIIPVTGQHLLSKLASFYGANTTDLVGQFYLFQNEGVAEFCKFSVMGLAILLIFGLLIGLKRNLVPCVSNHTNKWLYLFILVGLLTSGIAISYTSLKGLLFNSQIREGLRELDCSLDLFKQFHMTVDRNYSLFEFPQFLQKLTITSFKPRLKNNRIIWYTNHFLQNPKVLDELIIQAQNNKEVQNDVEARQFLRKLRQFHIVYQQLSQIINPKPSSRQYGDWVLHKNALFVYKQTRPYKLNLLNIKQITKEPLKLLSQLLSSQNKQQALLWLQIIDFISLAVVIVAIFLNFVGYRHISCTHNSLIYLTAMSCFLVFLTSLALSVALPYVGWGCEGANHLLFNQQNWNNQIIKSNFSDIMPATLQLLGPYSKKKSLDIVQKQQKEYFPKLKQKIQKFLPLQNSAYEYTNTLQSIYYKYLNTEQNKQKLNKFVISMGGQAFRSLEIMLKAVIELISIIPLEDSKNRINGQRVGRALRSSVNSMCTTNFNNLYQTRNRTSVLAYALLIFFILLSSLSYKKNLLKIQDIQQEEIGTTASSHRTLQARYDQDNPF